MVQVGPPLRPTNWTFSALAGTTDVTGEAVTPLKRVAGASASLAVVDGLGSAALVGEPGNRASIGSAAVAKLSDLGRDSIAISTCVHLYFVQASHVLAGTTKHETRSSGRSPDRPELRVRRPDGTQPRAGTSGICACFLVCLLVSLCTCLHPSSHVMTKDNTIRMTTMAAAMMATRFRSV